MNEAISPLQNLDKESIENIAISENNVETSEESIQATNIKIVKPKLKRARRINPIHLRTADMVNSAIAALNKPNGSSVQAIKKYIAKTYNIDTKKRALLIKKYLIFAVDSGVLYRTQGSGAAGSFRICNAQKHDASNQQKNINAESELSNKLTAEKKSAVVKKSSTVPELPKTAKEKEKETDAKKKAAAKKKQAAADKNLAIAMKKLAAATKK